MNISKASRPYNTKAIWPKRLEDLSAVSRAMPSTLFTVMRSLYSAYYRSYDPYSHLPREIRPLQQGAVSVLIPCFGHSKSIVQVVESVLTQTLMPSSIHVLLMDEESQLLSQELGSLSSKVHCVAHERLLPATARNYLKRYVSPGESHVLYLDADDPLTDTRILEDMWVYKEYDIVMPCWIEETTGLPVLAPSLFDVCYHSQTTALLRSDFLKNNSFNERYIHGVEDTEFFLRAYIQGASITYSKAKFTRSGMLKASHWAILDHGEYDLLWEYRDTFLPLIELLRDNVELNVGITTRLFYLAKLLREDLSYLSNIYELNQQASRHALWLMRSLAPCHLAREGSVFRRVADTWQQLALLVPQDVMRSAFTLVSSPSTITSPQCLTGVTVVIPCYGQSALVERAVESVLRQTRVDVVQEVLVLLMDKASWACRSRLEALSPLVKCYAEERMWLPEARNFLIARASGSHIIPLDADDQLGPQYIEKAIPYASAYDVVYTGLVDIEDLDPLTQAATMMPTALLTRRIMTLAPYSALYNGGLEERAFWFTILKRGASIKFLKEEQVLLYYKSSSTRLDSLDYSMSALAYENFCFIEFLIENRAFFTKVASMALTSNDSQLFQLASRFLADVKAICSGGLVNESDKA